MTRVGTRPLVLLVLLLTGCLGPTDDPPAGGDPVVRDRVTDPIDITLADCKGVEAFTLVPLEVVEPHVPPGLSPVDEGGQVRVLLGAMVCPDLQAARGFLAILVQADDPALAIADGESLFWEPEHLVTEGTSTAHAFAAVGGQATLGRVEVDVLPTGVAARIETPTGTHTITPLPGPVLPTAAEAALLPPFREYVAGHGGYAYLDGGFGGEAQGQTSGWAVTVETAPETPSRAILGATSTMAGIGFDGYGYPGATIGLVPYA